MYLLPCVLLPARYALFFVDWLLPVRLPRSVRLIVPHSYRFVNTFRRGRPKEPLIYCYSSGRVWENAWGLLEKNRTVATGKPDAPVQEVCHAANFRPQTPKNFQNMYCLLFGALFCHIFAIIFPEEPALLLPEIAKTPSRGPLSPLYGGKGSVLWGVGEL